ncbi:phage holin, lambda family [Proteus vulgaris]|uniref:phage holin, lambda family n=1 Tax=Proteus TaxID=583 RepID=UPI0018676A37|nr:MULTISPECIES: phage holin, lambda family [Proteus]MBI6530897.1 phage holin, lambda family [Proteus vulgaris]
MKENPDLWEQIFIALSSMKEQGISASLAGGMAILRGLYNGGGWKQTSIDGLMCAMFAWFIKDILILFNINHEFAYLASVFIGYVGVDSVSKLLKGRAGVKNG